MSKCNQHPEYDGTYKPINDCLGCWRVWKKREERNKKLREYWEKIKSGWWNK